MKSLGTHILLLRQLEEERAAARAPVTLARGIIKGGWAFAAVAASLIFAVGSLLLEEIVLERISVP